MDDKTVKRVKKIEDLQQRCDRLRETLDKKVDKGKMESETLPKDTFK